MDNIGYQSDNWENEWINRTKGEKLTRKLDDYYAERLESIFTSHEIYSIKTLLPGLPYRDYNNKLPMLRRSQSKMMNQYIKKKSEFLNK